MSKNIKVPKIEDILQANNCGDLFTNNEDTAKLEHKRMVQAYHTDICKHPDAAQAIGIINSLYDEAVKHFKLNTWEQSNKVFISKKDGKTVAIKFQKERKFELGVCYISNTVVAYILDSQHRKYYDNMLKQVKGLSYQNDKIKDTFEKIMPKIVDNFESSDGKFVVVIGKTPDMISLQDVNDYYNGKIDVKHTAWITSRLCNIACFLKSSGIVHNGITLENCFISPKYHSLAVYGGWWYTINEGTKMIGTSSEVYSIMPPKSKTEKVGRYSTDLESLKLVIRKLLYNVTAPDAFKNWVNSGSSDSALVEFQSWDKALNQSFGERKFIVWDASAEKIYNI